MKPLHGVLLVVAAALVYVLVNVGAIVLGFAVGYFSVEKAPSTVVYRYHDRPTGTSAP